MARKQLILDRYEPIGTAGSGGFGTVQIAWDPRIQRKVAIKTIQLTELDAYRAGLPGAQAVAKRPDDAGEGGGPSAPDANGRAERGSGASEAAGRAGTEADEDAAQDGAEAQFTEIEVGDEPWESPLSGPTADRWHGVQPWGEYLASIDADDEAGEGAQPSDDAAPDGSDGASARGSRALSLSLPEVRRTVKGAGIHLPEIEDGTAADAPGARAAGTEPGEGVAEGAVDEGAVDEGGAPDEPDVADWLDEPEAAGEADSEAEPAAGPPEPDETAAAPGEPAGEQPAQQFTALAHLPGLDEARTAAMLQDSRIVTVYDFEVRDRTAYLIMEYVEGITLTRLLSEYADYLTLDVVACVFDAVAGALMVAHKAGVLHLDIKPDNILINADGQAKVTDFGLATLADASGTGTTGGGTIGYMPLEQMRRQDLDARADEWSLAAVTYEMLTGDSPFRAPSLESAESAILDAELVLPSLCWDKLDSQIDDVIFYALDPDRDERYASVKDFAEEVEKFLGNAKRGKGQLALVVSDALIDDEEEDDEGEGGAAGSTAGEGDQARAAARPNRTQRFGFLGKVLGARGGSTQKMAPDGGRGARGSAAGGRGVSADPLAYSQDVAGAVAYDYDYDDYYEDYEGGGPAGRRGLFQRMRDLRERAPHAPLAQRVPEPVQFGLARSFSAVSCGLLGLLACMNVEGLASLFGANVIYIAVAVAIAAGIVGAVRPQIGALCSYCLLGAAIVLCGHPFVGAALIAVAALWFYIAGREGMADANVALSGPLAGALGASSAVPLLGGSALRPVQAGVTLAFSVVVAAVFASFGSGTLLGWDVFSHWDFTRADLTRNMGNLLVLPGTWATAAGWVVGALACSLLRLADRRWAAVAGIAVAACAVIAGTLVFSAPTPQLFVPVAIAAAVLFFAL